MNKKDIKEKINKFVSKKYKKCHHWFTEKEHPKSRLNKNVFFHDILKLIGLILVFLIINSNLEKLNNIILIFIKLGSTLQLVLAFFIIKKGIHLIKNLKYAYRGLNHGTKAVLAIIVVLILFLGFINQNGIINNINEKYDKIDLKELSPVTLENLNISLNLGSLSNKINTCPQVDVPITFYKYNTFTSDIGNIRGKSFDGWAIKGSATCREGKKEGENLNQYYCGGYTYTFGIGSVNAYIQKTIISKNGDIGKTYKYVIWNVYDENKEFIETKCLGNPDEFEEEQMESIYREFSMWN